MADNVAVTAGSGTTIAADEISDGTLGSVKVQYVKIMDGTLDGTSKAVVGANGLKVDASDTVQPVSQATASSLNAQVVGNVASAASDSGNPVKVAAKYNSTKPTFTDGQRGDLQIGTRGSLCVQLVGADSTPAVGASSTNSDGISFANALFVYPYNLGFNGASWDRVRLPNFTKTATATGSGDTAVWTPNSGKKFRLVSFMISVTQDAAQSAAGVIDIIFRDSTTAMNAGVSVFVPGAAGTTMGEGYQSPWINLGNGVLSASANNVLNINLSAALTSGKVRVMVAGTEE